MLLFGHPWTFIDILGHKTGPAPKRPRFEARRGRWRMNARTRRRGTESLGRLGTWILRALAGRAGWVAKTPGFLAARARPCAGDPLRRPSRKRRSSGKKAGRPFRALLLGFADPTRRPAPRALRPLQGSGCGWRTWTPASISARRPWRPAGLQWTGRCRTGCRSQLGRLRSCSR